MTDYPAANKQSWKKQEVRRNWRNILSIFLAVVLVFATANGFLKAFAFKKFFEKKLDTSWAIVTNSKQPTLLVLAKDPSRLVFISFSQDTYLPTGKAGEPLVTYGQVSGEGKVAAKVATQIFGVDVRDYLYFKDRMELDATGGRKWFGDFASPATAIAILSGNYKNKLLATNLTQGDLFRLWWQVKNLSANDLKFADFSSFYEEVIDRGGRVKVFDGESMHKEVTPFFISAKIQSAGARLKVVNGSGVANAGRLASLILESQGFLVSRVETADKTINRCQLDVGEKDEISRYLASIVNCDIVLSPKKGEESENTLIIGRDFASLYLE